MSLKTFHVVFIVAAFLLGLFLAGWCLNEYFRGSGRASDLILGIVALGGSAALVVYGRYFLKKLKDVDYF